jgi:hypothetical protein
MSDVRRVEPRKNRFDPSASTWNERSKTLLRFNLETQGTGLPAELAE